MNAQRRSKFLLIGLIIFTIVLWLPTPYVIMEPGNAMSVQAMVQLEEGFSEHGGDLMLTTVRMSYANVSHFLQSFFKRHANLYLKKSVLQGESPEEYSERQIIYMQTSQNNAIQAAYNKAEVPYQIKIVDNVQIIAADEASKQVRISADEIGGPSAGLVFALEIYSRLVPHSVTKGYTIAGTGSINPQGEVSPIGGVDYKVVAAHKAGADVFFVPEANGPLAMEQAARIKTNLKIVTVKTLDDALQYLAALPLK